MRRFAVPLVLALAVAAPSAAREADRAGGERPRTEMAGLRGAQPTPGPTPSPDAVFVPPPPVAARTGGPSDPSRCRVRCARDYYFCLADEADHCPATWSRCAARCG